MGRGDYNTDPDDEDSNYDGTQSNLIPGDNSLPLAPSDIPIPTLTDVPDNLAHIPAQGGEIPIVLEPSKPNN